MTNRRWIVAIALALLALTPDLAHACSVCFSANAKNREAFLATTAFLSLLPLGMAGGLWFWIRRRAGALARQAESVAEAQNRGAPQPGGDAARETARLAPAFGSVQIVAPAGSR